MLLLIFVILAGSNLSFAYSSPLILEKVADKDIETYDMPSATVLSQNTIDPGELAADKGSYTVMQSDIEGIVETSEGVTASDVVSISVIQNHSVVLNKDANKSSVLAAGEEITYTVTNDGTRTLSGISVMDDKLGAIGLNAKSLRPGTSTEGLAAFTVDQADMDSGNEIVNVATVTTVQGATDTDNASVSIMQEIGLAVSKSAMPATYSAVGDQITYTIIVENTGNVTLTEVMVTDLLTDLNTAIPSLAPGGQQTFTENYAITLADLNSGSVINTAAASGTAPNNSTVNASSTETIPGSQQPDLTVTKTASPTTYSSAGQQITYTIKVENTGNVILTDISVTDPQTVMNETIASLAPGGSQSFNEAYIITQSDISAGSLTNTVMVSGKDPDGETITSSGSVIIQATQNPELTVSKSALPATYSAVGNQITYTIEVENSGNVELTNVSVTDLLIGLAENIATMVPGATQTYTPVYIITQSDMNAGEVENTATVSGTAPDNSTVSASDTEIITGSQQSGLTVTKTASPNTYNSVGQEISYTIIVKNTGNVTLTEILVIDLLTGLNTTITALLPGEEETFIENYIITQADLNNGSLINTATARGRDPENALVSGSGTETITASQQSDLIVSKSASPTSYNLVGQEISYTIIVENAGNVTLTEISVSDPLTGMNETLGSLAPGLSQTYTEIHTITQSDIDAGSLSNTASATGKDPDGETINGNGIVIVTATQNTGLTVRKTASPSTYSSVGQLIGYTIIIENTGNVTLTEVSVTDPLTGLDQTIESFAPGQSQTYTETYSVTQTNINAGIITNTATASGKGPDGETVSGSGNATIAANQNPGLAINKTAAPITYSLVGQEISYTIVVENTGNVTLTEITITDPLTGLNTTIPNLPPGGTQTFIENYVITLADLLEGNVINIASTAGRDPEGSLVEADHSFTVTALNPPEANDDRNTNNLAGESAVIDILANDKLHNGAPALPALVTVDLDAATEGEQTELLVPGEGTWIYNPADGRVTFTPEAGFTTGPSPITYTLTETLTGRSDNATITVEYNEGEPFAIDDISTGNKPGNTVSINILANDRLSDDTPVTTENTTLSLVDPATELPAENPNELIIPGEGTWIYVPDTGILTFTPEAGYTTGPTPVFYLLTENLTGLIDDAMVTIIYDEEPPLARDDFSAGNMPGNAVVIDILANDLLSDGTPAVPGFVSVDLNQIQDGIQDELVVAGEGIWTYNATTGEVTFSPESGFTTDPSSITYSLIENLTGLSDNADVSIDYDEQPPAAADDISSGNIPGTMVVVDILANDRLSDGSPALPELVIVDLDPSTEGAQNELIVSGEGTWVYDPDTGLLTFTPASGFLSDPTPVVYSLCSAASPMLCDEATVTIYMDEEIPVASVALVKTGIYSSFDELITYTFTVTNTGNLVLLDLRIDDERIGVNNLEVLPDTLMPGNTGIVTATYHITQNDKDAGEVVNTALVRGISIKGELVEDYSGSEPDNDEPTITPVIQAPLILVEKEARLFAPEALLNETIDFEITVTNNGNVVLENILIRDPLTDFEQTEDQLKPGESVQYFTSYTVQPSDEENGRFENTATATGTAPDGTLVESSSTVTVLVEQCELVIPTGFSPNYDGIQDTWKIQCLEKYPDARIEIFNRWGNRVYEKENYGNTGIHGSDAWWDGYSTQGMIAGNRRLPTGTYYYILDLKNGSKPLNGFIFLNR